MTCIATNTPIINLGGCIVWSDVKPETGAIDPDDIEKEKLILKLVLFHICKLVVIHLK